MPTFSLEVDSSQSQIIWVNKPMGWTSRRALDFVIRKFRITKAGHTGTLDPMAVGLLGVVTNKATRLTEELMNMSKTYQGRIFLGVQTESADAFGWPVARNLVPEFTQEKLLGIERVLLELKEHTPPRLSAISIDGERGYDLFRKGVMIEMKSKPTKIYAASFKKIGERQIDFSLTVSRGTYIRSLGELVATQLGTLGYLESLNRVGLHGFDLPKDMILGTALKEPVVVFVKNV